MKIISKQYTFWAGPWAVILCMVMNCSKSPTESAKEAEAKGSSVSSTARLESVSGKLARDSTNRTAAKEFTSEAGQSGARREDKAGQPVRDEEAMLDRDAKALGLSKEELLLFLTRKQTLGQQFEAALESGKGGNRAVQMLQEMAKAIDSKAIKELSQTEKTGGRLPASFLTDVLNRDSEVDVGVIGPKMLRPSFMEIPVDKYPEQGMLWSATMHLGKNWPDLMVALLQERAKTVPPTVSDYLIYQGAFDGAMENPDLVMTDSTEPRKVLPNCKSLLNLATAPNPIYRLLSVNLARVVENDKARLVGFYSSFVNESDSVIQIAAIEGLESIRGANSISVLQVFQAKANQKGNTDVANAAQQAIERLNKR